MTYNLSENASRWTVTKSSHMFKRACCDPCTITHEPALALVPHVFCVLSRRRHSEARTRRARCLTERALSGLHAAPLPARRGALLRRTSALLKRALGSLFPPFKSATLSLFSHRPLWCRRKTREGLNKHNNH